jgi:hypothetical protein
VPKSSIENRTPCAFSWLTVAVTFFGVLRDQALGQLEIEVIRRKPRFLQDTEYPRDDVLLQELARGKIHRHDDRRRACVEPRATLGACGPQDPISDRDDQSGFLGDRDELSRRYGAELRVVPAQQRLAAGNLSRRETYLWLIGEMELALRSREPEPCLQPDAALDLVAHLAAEELVGVAPEVLCPVHRRAGIGDERIGVVAVPREDAYADACAEEHFASIEQDRLRERREGLLRNDMDVRRPAPTPEEHQELVAAVAADRVAFAHQTLEPVRRQADHRIAERMAESVVDHLEAVQVQVHQCDMLAGAPRVRDRLSDAVLHQAPVRQVRQLVVRRQILDAGLALLALGDVAKEDRDPALRRVHALLEPALPRGEIVFGGQRDALGHDPPVRELERGAFGLGEHILILAAQQRLGAVPENFGCASVDVGEAPSAVEGDETHGHPLEDPLHVPGACTRRLFRVLARRNVLDHADRESFAACVGRDQRHRDVCPNCAAVLVQVALVEREMIDVPAASLCHTAAFGATSSG